MGVRGAARKGWVSRQWRKRKGKRRDNEWKHKHPRGMWSLTVGFPQLQGEVRAQSSGYTDREPALRTILTGFLLSPPRAPAELQWAFHISTSISHFCSLWSREGMFSFGLLLSLVSFFSFWEDFLHKRSLSKSSFSGACFLKKKKKSLQIFLCRLHVWNTPIPAPE